MNPYWLLIPVLFFSAWSQAEEDLFDIGLEELGRVSVMGATLTPKSLQEVPNSVTVLSAAQIRELPVSTLEDLLRYIPGFQSVRGGDNTASNSYALRGRRIGSANREVLILVDGLRLHNAFTDGIAVQRVDIQRIKQIEFIRGPGSAVYGSNAFLGVINITTDYPDGELQLLAGDNLSQGLSVGQSQQMGEYKIGLYAREYSSDGAHYSHAESFGQNVGNTHENSDDKDVALQIERGRMQAAITYAGRHTQNGYLQETVADNTNSDETHYLTAQLQYGYGFSGGLDVSGRLYAQRWRRNALIVGAQGGALAAVSGGQTQPLLTDVQFRDDEYGFNLLGTYRENTQIGLEVGQSESPVNSHNNYDLLALTEGNFPIGYDPGGGFEAELIERHVRHKLGFFWQHQTHLGEHLQFLLGVRYDHYSDVGEHLSPRMAAVYQLNPADSLKFSYGEAFRAPAQNELYIGNNPVQRGNPDLRPETVETYEAIWTHMLNNGISELSYFENRFVDGIEQVMANDNSRHFQNTAGEETNRGIEYALQTPLNEGFALRLAGSYVLSMAPSAFRLADKTGSAVLSWRNRQWLASLSAFYIGETEFLNRQQAHQGIGDFWAWHSKLQYAMNADTQVFLQINNLFDRQYGSAPMGSLLNEPLPNPGFFALMGLIWHY